MKYHHNRSALQHLFIVHLYEYQTWSWILPQWSVRSVFLDQCAQSQGTVFSTVLFSIDVTPSQPSLTLLQVSIDKPDRPQRREIPSIYVYIVLVQKGNIYRKPVWMQSFQFILSIFTRYRLFRCNKYWCFWYICLELSTTSRAKDAMS